MPYPGNTARCAFQFTMPNGASAFCTPHVRSLDGTDLISADVEAIGGLLADWWLNDDFQGEVNGSMQLRTNENITLTSITVTGLAVASPPQWVESVNGAGSSLGTPLPNETAVVVTLYTGLVGRSFRGRNFWPLFGTSGMQTNGTIVDATLANVQTTFDALIAGLVTQGEYVLAVNSETLGQVNQVISATVRDTLHHQRRRNS